MRFAVTPRFFINTSLCISSGSFSHIPQYKNLVEIHTIKHLPKVYPNLCTPLPDLDHSKILSWSTSGHGSQVLESFWELVGKDKFRNKNVLYVWKNTRV